MINSKQLKLCILLQVFFMPLCSISYTVSSVLAPLSRLSLSNDDSSEDSSRCIEEASLEEEAEKTIEELIANLKKKYTKISDPEEKLRSLNGGYLPLGLHRDKEHYKQDIAEKILDELIENGLNEQTLQSLYDLFEKYKIYSGSIKRIKQLIVSRYMLSHRIKTYKIKESLDMLTAKLNEYINNHPEKIWQNS